MKKEREEPLELKLLKVLKRRTVLNEQLKRRIMALEKGYEGERRFDKVFQGSLGNCLFLNDLHFSHDSNYFQIDSLLISALGIHLYEIKNMEQEYFMEDNKLFKFPRYEISNPLNQLSRTELLFKQMLQKYELRVDFNPYVVFINPNFTLLQAPINKRIILPTQINHHLQSLSKKLPPLPPTKFELAKEILSLETTERVIREMPTYTFEELRKGVSCLRCGGLNTKREYRMIKCLTCSNVNSLDESILHTIDEFELLFPFERLTTSIIVNWCNQEISPSIALRILKKRYEMQKTKRWSYFVPIETTKK
ncbi:nuclease-related domain-containing protein [Mangrovibacillus cuniculi]|uniref:NERD domain-containing protein n=1 Tax=Mangrovibacillus cuniculi TaxID=2593652 RepID=A0A7S8CBC1_9BACI|nr:nuclease-related domain-containing protein [Mangrovibacillus cuniculi]QPC46840.1 NERD domain-containing protein [Mangrovibacillus cuniculi]